MKVCRLTTVDNPYDPFEQEDEWFAYDNLNGSLCQKMLGRFAYTSDSLSYEENNKEVERAIDDIILHDHGAIFKKVVKEIVE